jgi:ABC-type branched-subunit amino acid transport system ATPase component
VSVTVHPGEIVGLIGPNGSGKTTLLNLVSGVLSPTAGRVLIDGADATQWPAHKVAQAGVGRTFQNIRLFGHLSVLENVEIAATTRADGSTESARALARQLLAEFGLDGSADRLAGELDYGAQRPAGDCARPGAASRATCCSDEPGRRHEPDRIQPAAGRAGGAAAGAPASRCWSSITTCPSSCVSAIASWC